MDENVINSAMEEEMKKTEPSTDKELGKLAVEVWKIEKKIQKSKEKLSEEENKSFEFLFNRVNQILGNCNVKITDFSNQKWNDGMALLDIISVEEVEGLEFPVVGETISPLVEIDGEVSQKSKVVIYKPIEKEDKEPETIEELVGKKNSKKELWICLIALLIFIVSIIGVALFMHKSINDELNESNEEKIIDENQIGNANLIDEIVIEENLGENTDEIIDENTEIEQEPITEENMEITNENIDNPEVVEDLAENGEINNEGQESQPNTETVQNIE